MSRVRLWTSSDIGGRITGSRSPFARQYGVDRLALPLALDPLVLSQLGLAAHAELFQDARGGGVARLQPAVDAVQIVGREREREDGAGRFGRVAAAVVVGVEHEADLGLAVLGGP